MLGSLTLNGGTIYLSSDLNLGNDKYITGPGIIEMGNNDVRFGRSDIDWTTPIYWDSTDGGSISFGAKVTLKSTWTFEGVCEIKGNGNSLDLDQNGQITINDNSRLHIDGLTLQNVKNTNIHMVGDNSELILTNVVLVQSGGQDYTFERGALTIKNRVRVTGSGVFVYESTQTSTIHMDSQLRFDSGITFSYNPTNQAQDLIKCIDDTSEILLSTASLHSGVGGMNIKKGKLLVAGPCAISSEVVVVDNQIITDEGISFGDNTADNDVTIDIGIGAELSIASGSLNYRVTNSDKLIMRNAVSALSVESDAQLNVDQTLDLTIGRLLVKDAARVQVASGKEIIGSIIR